VPERSGKTVHPSVGDTIRLVQDLKNRLRLLETNGDDDNANFPTASSDNEHPFHSSNNIDNCTHVDTTESVSNCAPVAQNNPPILITPSSQSPLPLPRLPRRSPTGGSTHWPAIGTLSRAKRYRPPPPIPADELAQSGAESTSPGGSEARRSSSPAIFGSVPMARCSLQFIYWFVSSDIWFFCLPDYI